MRIEVFYKDPNDRVKRYKNKVVTRFGNLYPNVKYKVVSVETEADGRAFIDEYGYPWMIYNKRQNCTERAIKCREYGYFDGCNAIGRISDDKTEIVIFEEHSYEHHLAI